MGRSSTKLRDLPEIKASLRAQLPRIELLQDIRLASIPVAEFPPVLREIWITLDALTVSVADVKIVANSKVLHHILPELVPPIDRTYTYNLFYGRNMLSISERDAFKEILTRLHRVVLAQKALLQSAVGAGWYSSETKVIDNAVVGYVIETLRVEDE